MTSTHATPSAGRRFLAAAAGVAMVFALVSCGDDSDDGDAAGGVTVADAWARTSPTMATNGAVYMELGSEEGDVLIGASVPDTVAATTEIHETVAAGGDASDSTAAMSDTTAAMSDTTAAMSDTTMAGTGEMTMRPIESLEIPAGSTVTLAPGGYHIMLLELVEPLEVGSEIEVTLSFETAGELTITVPVLEKAP